jgi:tRNA (guanine26-N2/guanine27-N2)-dimethyltransferase
MGGPIWADPIHSLDFIDKMQKQLSNFNEDSERNFATHKRLHGILQVLSEELVDSPLYYSLDRLCRVVRCAMPSMKLFRSALLNAGFEVSYSHASKTSIKTNAPNVFVWDIMREIQKNYPKIGLDEKSPGFAIVSKSSSNQISFDIHEKAEPLSKEMQLLRYQVNPDSNWGPKSRPSKVEDKRALNQGKRSRTNDSQSSESLSKKISNK